ncbi:ribosomal large subunit pseudouridine synthase B [Desulfurobacterium pacificum]|uniref:Pseudouridine synthase n=1 Tax=Desulfurobacterium pacificum TaxID=240166 RepID=A0ABY1NFN1_9BACT|nr:pseudouridine synthase [Desulfurobacterium pacificum]SMP06707.1 ribosomal large subunit pseudouridine synthase B [Desulfurobacterium pacificum]
MRLNKFLAYAGFGARRKVEEIIKQGRVTVNGEEVTSPAVEVDPKKDRIEVDGERVRLPKKFVYIMFNKPQGVLTAMERAPGDKRPIVADYFRKYPVRLFPVGRLDYNTEGLLLMTNDGELAEKLMHPRYHVPKTYIAKVKGRVTPAEVDRMRKGALLVDDKGKKFFIKPLDVKLLHPSKTGRNTYVQITIDQGKNRVVRRFFDRFDHGVLKLKRVAVGPLKLGDLPKGRYRELTKEEVEKLKKAVESYASKGN